MLSGAALAGTSPGRADADFYRTPDYATEALLAAERFDGGVIWEPSCGDGAISRVLWRHYPAVHSTDLHNRGYPEQNAVGDFLQSAPPSQLAHVVTNPPFTLAQQFATHALELLPPGGKLALFLKLPFLESEARRPLFARQQLQTVYVFRKRVTLYRNGVKCGGGGTIAFAWYVWRQDYCGDPAIKWL